MPPKKKTSKSKAGTDISFEDAISKVEEIVEEMENDQLPLEKLVAHYEKGSSLLSRCEELLQNARKRIELLTINPEEIENGLDDSEEVADDSLTATGEDDPNEIRLF